MERRLVVQQLASRPDVHDAAGVEHDRIARDALHDAEVLLDEQNGVSSETRSRASATSVTSSGDSPFVGSSMSSSRLSFRSARPIASICCCPPESVPAACLPRCRSSGNRS